MANEVKEPALKYNILSPAAYLLMERAAAEKHEYYDGLVLGMSGASLEHNTIEVNLITAINTFLKGKNCRILPSRMRVSTPSKDSYMYPDASIECGEPQLEDDKFDTLLNPSVIFEILSPSTRSIDKGRKFFFYNQIPSLQKYIMIDSLKQFIQLALKQPDGSWMFEQINPAAVLFIRSIQFQLPLSEIYTGVGL